MTLTSSYDEQIIGFRKDRLGARITSLGNILFLEQKFNTTVRFLWTVTSEEHSMDILDPAHPIFAQDFLEKYIVQVSSGEHEEVTSNLTAIEDVRGRISAEQFESRLKAGERFLCDSGFSPIAFANETEKDLLEPFRASLKRISWAPCIYQALDEAEKKLRSFPGKPLGLHVRRGDILSKEPWCHRNWTSKFVPDEFYTVVMDRPDTTTILFSDTPEVIARLVAERKNALAVSDLISMQGLSTLQRDLLELLILARCDKIVAPILSAFSSLATLLEGTKTVKLPLDLPPSERDSAYDSILSRALYEPDSFYNEGDFAQSIGYAFPHALNVGQYTRLYEKLNTVMQNGQTFAFYLPFVMALAISTGNYSHAIELSKIAKESHDIWGSDKMSCASLACLAEHASGNKRKAFSDFLNSYFSRQASNTFQDSIAHYFLIKEPQFQEIFNVDSVVVETLCKAQVLGDTFFPRSDSLFDGSLNAVLPLWITGADWSEMFEKKGLQNRLTNSPSFVEKQSVIPNDILDAERNYFREQAPLPGDPDSLKLLSIYAVALRLSGRYRRAVQVMYHCRNNMPQHPIFLKRLGDQLLTLGNLEGAQNNFRRASEILPHHPGLTLARARIAQKQGDHHTAVRLLALNADQEILPLTYFKSWEFSMRKLKSRSGARDVIRAAYARFPDHTIFKKRWADVL